jgi:hypothetical protein
MKNAIIAALIFSALFILAVGYYAVNIPVSCVMEKSST